jgi:hypothetical protein
MAEGDTEEWRNNQEFSNNNFLSCLICENTFLVALAAEQQMNKNNVY